MSEERSLAFVTVTADAPYEEPIVGRLAMLGLTELEIVHPAAETVQLTVYACPLPGDALRADLEGLVEWCPGFSCEVREGSVPDVEWYERWKEHFVPLAVGRRFEVRPPWAEQPVPEGRIPLLIEPRNAFGTGYHETTQLILEALEDMPLAGVSLLDAGCGSGILAIAAAHLGATPIRAFDHDPEATENAVENVRVNGVADRIEVQTAAPAAVAGEWQVVVANIIANVLEVVRDDLVRLTAPGGTLVLCGLLEGDQQGIQALYEAAGLTLVEAADKNGWHRLSFRR